MIKEPITDRLMGQLGFGVWGLGVRVLDSGSGGATGAIQLHFGGGSRGGGRGIGEGWMCACIEEPSDGI